MPSRPKILPVSDIHRGFWIHQRGDAPDLSELAREADLVILAGDVDVGEAGVDYARDLAERAEAPVVYVTGNHEYYHHDMAEIDARIRAAATNSDVHVLLDDVAEFDLRGERVRVVGSTLWTDYKLYGAARQMPAMLTAFASMNDHRLITVEGGRRNFLPDDAAAMHAASRDFLARTLAAPFDGRTIVVTHHAPSGRAQPEKYQGGSLAPAFCNDMEDFVAQSGADLWVCGHTHGDFDAMIGGTRLYSCQLGYPGEKSFRPRIIGLGDAAEA